MSKAMEYGKYYWCITGEGDPLYLYADRLEVTASGALLAWGGGSQRKPETVIYAIAKGQWETAYAAKLDDGSMACSDNYDAA